MGVRLQTIPNAAAVTLDLAVLLYAGEAPTGFLPVLRLDGQDLIEHLSILRLLAKRAGCYGRDDRADYLADALADAVSTGFRQGTQAGVCWMQAQGQPALTEGDD